jgi:transposase
MKETHPVLGIDISKKKFDSCLITAAGGKEKYRTFNNEMQGFEQVSRFLQQNNIDKAHVCMEPTGRFGNKLALWLIEQGHLVSVVNPYQIKGYAISELKRSKTDKIDAGVIARFCQMHRPKEWMPSPKAIEELKEIGRYVDELKTSIVREKNRLSAGVETEHVCKAIERHIAYLDGEIQLLKSRMHAIVKCDVRLKQAFEVLSSICGVGELAAFAFLGEIGLGDRFRSTRQVEAYCGLNPKLRQSGSSINRKPVLSKMGNNRMRRALYMPALTALRCNPAMQAYAERLRAAGKQSMVIVGAIMRKLLRVMFAVVRSNCAYEWSAHMERITGRSDLRTYRFQGTEDELTNVT